MLDLYPIAYPILYPIIACLMVLYSDMQLTTTNTMLLYNASDLAVLQTIKATTMCKYETCVAVLCIQQRRLISGYLSMFKNSYPI